MNRPLHSARRPNHPAPPTWARAVAARPVPNPNPAPPGLTPPPGQRKPFPSMALEPATRSLIRVEPIPRPPHTRNHSTATEFIKPSGLQEGYPRTWDRQRLPLTGSFEVTAAVCAVGWRGAPLPFADREPKRPRHPRQKRASGHVLTCRDPLVSDNLAKVRPSAACRVLYLYSAKTTICIGRRHGRAEPANAAWWADGCRGMLTRTVRLSAVRLTGCSARTSLRHWRTCSGLQSTFIHTPGWPPSSPCRAVSPQTWTESALSPRQGLKTWSCAAGGTRSGPRGWWLARPPR